MAKYIRFWEDDKDFPPVGPCDMWVVDIQFVPTMYHVTARTAKKFRADKELYGFPPYQLNPYFRPKLVDLDNIHVIDMKIEDWPIYRQAYSARLRAINEARDEFRVQMEPMRKRFEDEKWELAQKHRAEEAPFLQALNEKEAKIIEAFETITRSIFEEEK